jgi:hypothetical protein
MHTQGARQQAHHQPSRKPELTLLILLVCADVAFILLHLLYVETPWLRGIRLSLEAERGMPETYQYVKEFWIVACMGTAFWHTRRGLYASWAAVFAFVLIDDAAQIHERMGTWIGHRYSLPVTFGLRPDDVGELLFAGIVGTTMLTMILLTSWRGGEQLWRVSRDMLCLFLVFAFLGVLVDTLHAIAYLQRSAFERSLLILEDGGEMIIMSGITVYAFHVASHFGQTRVDLWASLKTRLDRTGRSRALLDSRRRFAPGRLGF